MNREIKFRAWEFDAKEFLYLDPNKTEFDSKWLKTDEQSTVQQFTGLTDTNGKEIYEGDIIEFSTQEYTCFIPDDEFEYSSKEECRGYYQTEKPRKWVQVQEWSTEHAGFKIRKFELEPYSQYPEA